MELNINCSKKAGIYKLTCLNNGKIYIGKSISLKRRLNRHKNSGNDIKERGLLKRAILKYGWDSFTVEILKIFENFDKSKLEDRLMILDVETSYIVQFDSDNREKGYNLCRYSTDRTGIPHSEETKKKMSKARMGKKMSEETKEKLRQLTRSDETKKKISKSKIGLKISEDHKEKLRNSLIGRPVSEETKEKIRLGNIGKVRGPMSEEHKEKIRQSNLGKTLSDETKLKIGLYHKGKVTSEETKEKLRKSRIKNYMKGLEQ